MFYLEVAACPGSKSIASKSTLTLMMVTPFFGREEEMEGEIYDLKMKVKFLCCINSVILFGKQDLFEPAPEFWLARGESQGHHHQHHHKNQRRAANFHYLFSQTATTVRTLQLILQKNAPPCFHSACNWSIEREFRWGKKRKLECHSTTTDFFTHLFPVSRF